MNNDVSSHGTYLLLLKCDARTELSIGKLGNIMTEPGYYLYVGSAFGPGGIKARINHHKKLSLRPHWHIDYLRTEVDIVDAWCVYGFRYEHEWAQSLIHSGNTAMPLTGFGSSDCACATHLFQLKHKPVKAGLEKLLKNKLSSVSI